jgi:hypothetical protein
MNLNKYLESIQDESVGGFAIDSFGPTTKKRDILRTVYPEQENIIERPHRKRIMVDFDGVISTYKHGWNDGKLADPPQPGVRESLSELKDKGLEVVIFTTRASKQSNTKPSADELIKELEQYLEYYNIPYDFITAEKLSAIAYIDDKAVRFTNWLDVMDKIRQIIREGD